MSLVNSVVIDDSAIVGQMIMHPEIIFLAKWLLCRPCNPRAEVQNPLRLAANLSVFLSVYLISMWQLWRLNN